MELFDLYFISFNRVGLINPTSPEKILKMGEVMEFSEKSNIIEFGSGFAEVLALLGEKYQISGTGIEIYTPAHERGKKRIDTLELSDKISLINADASKYKAEDNFYDAALSIGTSFIWAGFEGTLKSLKKVVKSDGLIAIGEPYWTTDNVPKIGLQNEPATLTQKEIFEICLAEGYDITYVIHSTQADWDYYNSNSWNEYALWLNNNQNHPDFNQVKEFFHNWQRNYFSYEKEYMGYAIFILRKQSYNNVETA